MQLSHLCVGHWPKGLNLNHLRRSGVWAINANSIVEHIICRCVICFRLRRKLWFQQTCMEAGPLTYSSVDIFGPILVRKRQSEPKHNAALFICVSSRAAHIGTTNTIEPYSFIMALHRSQPTRAAFWLVWYDNETNFYGEDNELQKALKEIDHDKIKIFLQRNDTDWILWRKNSPGASYMECVWEIQVWSAKHILEWLIRTHGQPDDNE